MSTSLAVAEGGTGTLHNPALPSSKHGNSSVAERRIDQAIELGIEGHNEKGSKEPRTIWDYKPEKASLDENLFFVTMSESRIFHAMISSQEAQEKKKERYSGETMEEMLELLLSAIWYAAIDYNKANKEIQHYKGQADDLNKHSSELQTELNRLRRDQQENYIHTSALSNKDRVHAKDVDRREVAYRDLANMFTAEQSKNTTLKDENRAIKLEAAKLRINLAAAEAALVKPAAQDTELPIRKRLDPALEELGAEAHDLYGEKEQLKKDVVDEKRNLINLRTAYATELKAYQSLQSKLSGRSNDRVDNLQQTGAGDLVVRPVVDYFPRSRSDFLSEMSPNRQTSTSRELTRSIPLPGDQSLVREHESDLDDIVGSFRNGMDNFMEDDLEDVIHTTEGSSGYIPDPDIDVREWGPEWCDPEWNPYRGTLAQLPPKSDGTPHDLARASDFRGRAYPPPNTMATNPVSEERGEDFAALGRSQEEEPSERGPKVPIAPEPQSREDAGPRTETPPGSPRGDPKALANLGKSLRFRDGKRMALQDRSRGIERATSIEFIQRDAPIPTQGLDIATQSASPFQTTSTTSVGDEEQMISPMTIDPGSQKQDLESAVRHSMAPLRKRTTWPRSRQQLEADPETAEPSKNPFDIAKTMSEAQKRLSIDSFLSLLHNGRRISQDLERLNASAQPTQPQTAKSDGPNIQISTSDGSSSKSTRRRTITFDKGTKEPFSPRTTRKKQWQPIDGLLHGLLILLLSTICFFVFASTAARRERNMWLQANDTTDARQKYLVAADTVWEYKHSMRSNDLFSSFVTGRSGGVRRGYLG